VRWRADGWQVELGGLVGKPATLTYDLLAYEFDGEPLDAGYGGPVRALCPYLWGCKSAESVVAITLVDHSVPGFWEVRGYPDNAQIKPGHVLDVNTGRRRRIPGGEVIEFLD